VANQNLFVQRRQAAGSSYQNVQRRQALITFGHQNLFVQRQQALITLGNQNMCVQRQALFLQYAEQIGKRYKTKSRKFVNIEKVETKA
jgi:hypothetical protein